MYAFHQKRNVIGENVAPLPQCQSAKNNPPRTEKLRMSIRVKNRLANPDRSIGKKILRFIRVSIFCFFVFFGSGFRLKTVEIHRKK
jgi:hypothetical protein